MDPKVVRRGAPRLHHPEALPDLILKEVGTADLASHANVQNKARQFFLSMLTVPKRTSLAHRVCPGYVGKAVSDPGGFCSSIRS